MGVNYLFKFPPTSNNWRFSGFFGNIRSSFLNLIIFCCSTFLKVYPMEFPLKICVLSDKKVKSYSPNTTTGSQWFPLTNGPCMKQPRYWFSAKIIMIFGISAQNICKEAVNRNFLSVVPAPPTPPPNYIWRPKRASAKACVYQSVRLQKRASAKACVCKSERLRKRAPPKAGAWRSQAPAWNF